MKNFIVNNNDWLEYLPVLKIAVGVIIVAFLIVTAFLFYKRIKNKELKSRNRKSAFAMAYAEQPSSHRISNVLSKKRKATSEDTHFEHVRRRSSAAVSRVRNNDKARILEFYFEYEDDYRI